MKASCRVHRTTFLAIALTFMVMSVFANERVVLTLEFASEENLSAYEWLDQRDFESREPSVGRDKIKLFQSGGALHIVTEHPVFGMAVRQLNVPNAKRLRLTWGVSKYPEGASFQDGIDNEAIMIYVFFGEERLPSGELFIPDSPWFLGFYLCPVGVDDVKQPYKGHHYKKTGRYVCVAHQSEGEVAENEIDLLQLFKRSFGLDVVPTVSGIGIEVDTTDAKNDGHAAAFIQKLEFLE